LGVIQPTDLNQAGLSINASLPLTVFSPAASFNFLDTNLNFNSLNYVTCTGATTGFIVEFAALIGYAVGTTMNIAASATSTGVLTVQCLGSDLVPITLFSFDTAAIKNTVYTAVRVALAGLSTDWVRLIHT
jgi:hypothetical protein